MSTKLLDRFQSPGPKRILALDGGGIRGAITLGFLHRIETLLRKQHGNDKLLLCDYFDLIGGTSTGAIIAALLATGHEVSDIIAKYRTLGGKIFGDKYSYLQIGTKVKATYDFLPLQSELKALFGDIKLGSDDICTGICVNAKRADTNSTWSFLNHPESKFYNAFRTGELGNKDYLLREVVRSSTAAPTYFLPQRLNLGDRNATFVDGGVSMVNNPALQLFLIATLNGFPFHWKTGADQLLLTSIGTGTFTKRLDAEKIANNNMLDWAGAVPDMLMEDASYLNQIMLQYLSKSPTAIEIDMEMGDLRDDLLHGQAAMHYLRYQAYLDQPRKLEDGSYEDRPNLPYEEATLLKMREMDKAEFVEQHIRVGEIYAQKYVLEEHFPEGFMVSEK